EAVELRVEPLRADLGVDLVADRLPVRDRRLAGMQIVVPPHLDAADRPVEGDPGHDLGMDEVAPPAAHLPDALVRLPPRRLEMLDERLTDAQALLVLPHAAG